MDTTPTTVEDRTTQDQRTGLQFLMDLFQDTDKRVRACLEGYAGVGKTWLVGHWLERVLLENPKYRICVAAPTHKALQVLRTKCGELAVVFRTVDSLLGFRVSRDEDGEMKRGRGFVEYPYDLVVVDEGSMLKEEYVSLCDALPCKVLYIGDPKQLPPINEETSPCFKLPRKHTMTQVVRQNADNPITGIATALRLRQDNGGYFLLPDAKTLAGNDKRVTFCSRERAYEWFLRAMEVGMDARILAYTNRTVTAYNAVLHSMLYPAAPLFGVGEWVLVNEAFPLPKQDDEEDELLSNGTMLKVLECEPGEVYAGIQTYRVRCLWPDAPTSLRVDGADHVTGRELLLEVAGNEAEMLATRKALTNQIWDLRKKNRTFDDSAEIKRLRALRKPLNSLAPLRHSYACTVHKSQGSTYDAAFVDWSDIYPSEDRLKLLYVAVTRPSKFLVFIK